MISRHVHARLDAIAAAALVAGPAAAGWRRGLRGPLAAAGLGTAAYSLMTRYDDDGRAPLSMRTHLALDALQGAAFCAAALSRRETPEVRRVLGAYGLFAIAAALMTDRGPPVRAPEQVPLTRDVIVRAARGSRAREVAPDIAWCRLGIVNVVFLGRPDAGDRGWILIDTGLMGTGYLIESAAAERFGPDARPSAIVMTHGHFDHVGALTRLAERWDVPVYAHPLEHPYLTGAAAYPAGDPNVGGGAIAALSGFFPTGPVDVSARLRPLPEDGHVPGAPGWCWLHTPGHALGHVSLWREADRSLIAADAVVTTRQESAYAVATLAPEMHGPPAYFTIEWDQAGASARRLAELEPELIVTGHGAPMAGPQMRAALHRLADNFQALAVPQGRRYAEHPARPGEGAYQ